MAILRLKGPSGPWCGADGRAVSAPLVPGATPAGAGPRPRRPAFRAVTRNSLRVGGQGADRGSRPGVRAASGRLLPRRARLPPGDDPLGGAPLPTADHG